MTRATAPPPMPLECDEARAISRRGAAAGLGVLMLPTRGWTQPIAKPKRVGVLSMWAEHTRDENGTTFVNSLADLGWAEGKQVVFERRGSQGHAEGLDEAARELVLAQVDVIFALSGTAPAQAAQRATSTIPIVFFGSTDPVGMGLVASLAKPGANVTGNAALTLARRAARYVERILRGAKPADLPVEIVSDLQLSVNARTARTLGLGVPQWIRLRATQVIE